MYKEYNPNPASIKIVGDCAIRAVAKALDTDWESAYIKLDVGALDIVDKLAHAIKNIDKIIEQEDYSERSYRGRSYRGSYRDSYRDSYGDSYGSYRRRRDSMGRYARNDMVDELRNLANSAPDQRTREKIERFIEEME